MATSVSIGRKSSAERLHLVKGADEDTRPASREQTHEAPAPDEAKEPGKSRDRAHLVHMYRRGRIWWLQYVLDGARVRESLKTDNRKIADGLRADREFRLRNRQLGLPRATPLSPFLKEFFANAKVKRTKKGFMTDFGRITNFFEAVPVRNLNDLTTGAVTAHLNKRHEAKEIKGRTANRIRTSLHRVYSYALDQGYVSANPISKVERFPESAGEIVFLTLKEIDELLDLVRGDVLFPVVATLIYAGLRRAEACWLKWTDVELDDMPRLKVVPKNDEDEDWEPKTKRTRIVPLSPKLVRILRSLKGKGEWVFRSPEGHRWDGDNLSHRFAKIMRRAKRLWNFLILRHTFGSHLSMRGVAIQKIAAFMGNSVQVCIRHYAGLRPEQLQSDVEF